MGRTVRSKEPYIKPVKQIELSDKHIRLRIVAVIVFLLIGVGAIVFGVVKLVNGEKGWKTVEGGKILGNYYDDTVFFEYNVKNGSDLRGVQSLYQNALARIAPLFDAYEGYEGINNIYYINRHVNEQIVVDGLLYSAFEKINENNFRTVFIAPFYDEYSGVLFADTDYEAESYDPKRNEEVKERADRIAAFAADKNSIDLRLLGNNTVMLYVSDEYRAYLKEIGSELYIDLWLVKNAFIVDYCADVITGNGYSGGRISSSDGYIRNFDSGTQYTYNVLDLYEGNAVISGKMFYNGAISAVTMNGFPVKESDKYRYCIYSDGQVRSEYLDAKTCLDTVSVPSMTVYSYGKKCSDIAFIALDSYIRDGGVPGKISSDSGIYYIYSDGLQIYYSEKGVSLGNCYTEPVLSE